MIACETTTNHPMLRNVLFADGHTQSMPEENFQREIGDPHNSNLESALSKVEAHGGLGR